MTVNELIAELQVLAAQGHGELDVTRYNADRYSAEYGDYIPVKKVARKEHPKGMDDTYIPYGSQDFAVTFVALL